MIVKPLLQMVHSKTILITPKSTWNRTQVILPIVYNYIATNVNLLKKFCPLVSVRIIQTLLRFHMIDIHMLAQTLVLIWLMLVETNRSIRQKKPILLIRKIVVCLIVIDMILLIETR